MSPGFKDEPSGNKAVKNDALRRNGVTLHFFDINKMNVDAFEITTLQVNYDLAKNNFTQIEDEKNNIYK